MNPNTMTAEPNHQNPPSVFGFDPYPPPYVVNWNQANPFANPSTNFTTIPGLQSQIYSENPTPPFATICPQLSPIMPDAYPQPQGGFSFGTRKPSEGIIQFPFAIAEREMEQREIRCKRKTDSPPLQPLKQHITEEKMAEHMSKLHISSATPTSKESENVRLQRLYMCEEMRKLQTDSILPQTLMSQIQRPCTALVLWKPPTRLLPALGNNDGEESENNNAESVPDHNVMENESEMENVNEVIVNNMDMDNC